jgi:hypothetical protein
LKLSLVDRLQIDEGKVGRLVGGFGTMFGPTILLCGFLTDAVGRKGVWLAGSAAVAVSIVMLARTRTYRGALVAVVLLGIGWAAQVNVSNVLMRVAVPADRPREQLVWATNFFDFAFGFEHGLQAQLIELERASLGPPIVHLVDRHHRRGAACANSFRDLLIARNESFPSVGDEDDQVGSLESTMTPLDNQFVKGILAALCVKGS